MENTKKSLLERFASMICKKKTIDYKPKYIEEKFKELRKITNKERKMIIAHNKRSDNCKKW